MRCYNGAPDSELKAVWDADKVALKRLAAAGLHATYFPMECKWMVFYKNTFRPVGEFQPTLLQATDAALCIEGML